MVKKEMCIRDSVPSVPKKRDTVPILPETGQRKREYHPNTVPDIPRSIPPFVSLSYHVFKRGKSGVTRPALRLALDTIAAPGKSHPAENQAKAGLQRRNRHKQIVPAESRTIGACRPSE